jgi:hypothetical protein
MKIVIGLVLVVALASAASAQTRIIVGDPPPWQSPVLFGPPGPPPECLLWNWQQYSYYNHCRAGYRPGALRVRG